MIVEAVTESVVVDDPEAAMAAAVFSLADLREACHEWLAGLLDALEKQGKLSATAQVVLTPEGCAGTSEIGMMMSVTFMPLDGGQPVVPAVMPAKGVVH